MDTPHENKAELARLAERISWMERTGAEQITYAHDEIKQLRHNLDVFQLAIEKRFRSIEEQQQESHPVAVVKRMFYSLGKVILLIGGVGTVLIPFLTWIAEHFKR